MVMVLFANSKGRGSQTLSEIGELISRQSQGARMAIEASPVPLHLCGGVSLGKPGTSMYLTPLVILGVLSRGVSRICHITCNI